MGFAFLESFDAPQPEPEAPRLVPETELEAARQEGYAQGYGSGWEAASAAAAEDQARIGADLAQHVQELGFTFHEARAHVMKGLEPLLREVFETLLPAVMVDALGHTILQELRPLAEAATNPPVCLAVAPEDADRLRTVLGENTPVPLRIDADPALASGQADLRLGQIERLIDLAGVVARLGDALAAVEDINERSLAHG